MGLFSATQPQPTQRSDADLERDALYRQLAALRIKLAAAEDSARQWQQIHEASVETWRATYALDTAILKAALLDVHHALVIDRHSPENRTLAGMEIQ